MGNRQSPGLLTRRLVTNARSLKKTLVRPEQPTHAPRPESALGEDSQPLLAPAAMTMKAMTTLLARKGALGNPRTNAEINNQAPSGTTKPSKAPSAHPAASATKISAIPTAILLHVTARLWLKPKTKGEIATHTPRRILVNSAPIDSPVLVWLAFTQSLSLIENFARPCWFAITSSP